MKKFLSFIIFFCFSFFIISCVSTVALEQNPDFGSNESLSYSIPFGIVYVTKIDLDREGLQLICKVDTENFFTIEEFAQETHAVYAFNTTPFFYDEENNAQLLGITKINGVIVSEPVERYSALAFYLNEEGKLRGEILKNQTENEIKSFPAVFGGYFTILENGTIQKFKNRKKARTACGLSSNGAEVYVLSVVSNLKSGFSGLSYEDCAKVLLKLGCNTAMEFDGGHSTAFICPEFSAVCTKKSRKIPAALGFFAL